jgi:Cytochrome c3
LSIRMSVILGLIICFVLGSFTLFGRDLRADDNAMKVASSKHQQRGGMECNDCHKGTPPKPLSSKDCLSCHESFEAVAAATAQSKPNPHDSPHYGKELDCELCHHEHSPSENFCAQCHDRNSTVP